MQLTTPFTPRLSHQVIEVLRSLCDEANVAPLVTEIYGAGKEDMARELAGEFREMLTVPPGTHSFFDDPEVAVFITACEKRGIEFPNYCQQNLLSKMDDGRFVLDVGSLEGIAMQYAPKGIPPKGDRRLGG